MYQKELALCLALSERAGELALEVYRSEFGIDYKGSDPVTEADRRVNTYLTEAIQAAFPNDLVVGEESAQASDIQGDRIWFIDPVDGTADFVKRNGEWSIMVGLVVEGKPRVGMVFQPATSDLYYASSGAGAWHQIGSARRQLRVSDDDNLTHAMVVQSRSHPDKLVGRLMSNLGLHREYQHGSLGCKLAQIAEHRADLYLNFSGKCHMWDVAGPEVILREAGGALLDTRGRALRYSGASTRVAEPFIATTSRLMPPLLAYLATQPDMLGGERV